MKKTKKPQTRKFHLSIRLRAEGAEWETKTIPLILSKTSIRPVGVVVYEEKRKGEALYLTEYVVG